MDVTVTDNEATPTATLVLTPATIDESGATNTSMVTATLSGASNATVTLTVAAAPHRPRRGRGDALRRRGRGASRDGLHADLGRGRPGRHDRLLGPGGAGQVRRRGTGRRHRRHPRRHGDDGYAGRGPRPRPLAGGRRAGAQPRRGRTPERGRRWPSGGAAHGSDPLRSLAHLGTAHVLGRRGPRDDLIKAPAGGIAPALALTSDALWARTSSERVRGLAASDSAVTRLRLGLESGWHMALEGGGALKPRLEARAP